MRQDTNRNLSTQRKIINNKLSNKLNYELSSSMGNEIHVFLTRMENRAIVIDSPLTSSWFHPFYLDLLTHRRNPFSRSTYLQSPSASCIHCTYILVLGGGWPFWVFLLMYHKSPQGWRKGFPCGHPLYHLGNPLRNACIIMYICTVWFSSIAAWLIIRPT